MNETHNLALFSRASDRGAYAELRQLLPSQIQVISPSIDQIMDFIAKLRKVDGSEVDIELALREALANAIVHVTWKTPASTPLRSDLPQHHELSDLLGTDPGFH